MSQTQQVFSDQHGFLFFPLILMPNLKSKIISVQLNPKITLIKTQKSILQQLNLRLKNIILI